MSVIHAPRLSHRICMERICGEVDGVEVEERNPIPTIVSTTTPLFSMFMTLCSAKTPTHGRPCIKPSYFLFHNMFSLCTEPHFENGVEIDPFWEREWKWGINVNIK
jgi:hypothetical protein